LNKKEIGSYVLVGLSVGTKKVYMNNNYNEGISGIGGVGYNFGVGYDFNKHLGVQLCCKVHNYVGQATSMLGCTITFTF
jgi:hypothetical protein